MQALGRYRVNTDDAAGLPVAVGIPCPAGIDTTTSSMKKYEGYNVAFFLAIKDTLAS